MQGYGCLINSDANILTVAEWFAMGINNASDIFPDQSDDRS